MNLLYWILIFNSEFFTTIFKSINSMRCRNLVCRPARILHIRCVLKLYAALPVKNNSSFFT